MFPIPIGVFADNEQITSPRGEVQPDHGVSTPESIDSDAMSTRRTQVPADPGRAPDPSPGDGGRRAAPRRASRR